MERTSRKCFRCRSEDHLLAKCPNPPKDNKKRKNQVHFNEKGNGACNNKENNSDQKVYSYMSRMSGNEKCSSGNSGDSSQLTDWILDYGATCHMTPEISDSIPGLLEDTNKHIEVADRHHVTAEKKVNYK